MNDDAALFDAALATARSDSRPQLRGDEATTDGPSARATIAPCAPSFVVADHDRDAWRISDGQGITPISRATVLACDFDASLLVIEGCHLVPQGDYSVSAPFAAAELCQLARSAFARGVDIRTAPNRRIPRAWAEIEPGTEWDQRDKARDAEIWHRWLSAKPERLASCRHWPPVGKPSPAITELRAVVMRDVNMVRQWRQFPESPQAKDFAARVTRALLAIFKSYKDGAGLLALTAQLGCPKRSRTQWDVLGSAYVSDAYSVGCDPRTGEPRQGLSARRVRRICGLYMGGYPTQVRSDLRHHGRALARPTVLDRAFVDLTMRFNRGPL